MTGNSIQEAVEDNSEIIIDKFSRNFLDSAIADVIGDFSVISTAKGIAAGLYSLANWRIARNIQYFIEGLRIGVATQEDYKKLSKKYGRQKLLENALLSLEAMRSEKQALAYSFLFNAMARGDLDWRRYCELQNILEKIDPYALDEDFSQAQPTHRLVSVGLAYLKTVSDGVKLLPNGQLYNDFKEFIVIPYRNFEKKGIVDT